MAVSSHPFQYCTAQDFNIWLKKKRLLISIDNIRTESVNVLETNVSEHEY